MNVNKYKLNTEIIWASRKHYPKILDIEYYSFPEEPIDKNKLHELLAKDSVIGMAAEYQGNTIGYVIYDIVGKKNKSIEILSIGVDDAFRLKGVGRKLIDHVKNKVFATKKYKSLYYYVREYNLDGQKFMNKMGFSASLARNYFDSGLSHSKPGRDAYLFEILND
jgi:ribosomal protein S18 acetylase RimI-like enzyme